LGERDDFGLDGVTGREDETGAEIVGNQGEVEGVVGEGAAEVLVGRVARFAELEAFGSDADLLPAGPVREIGIFVLEFGEVAG